MAADGLGQGDDEAEEVLGSWGVVEFANVFRGCDFLRWGLEVERRGDGDDLLGLRDRSEDYGLRVVHGGRTNGSGKRGRGNVGPGSWRLGWRFHFRGGKLRERMYFVLEDD